jgi:hypothetical protein
MKQFSGYILCYSPKFCPVIILFSEQGLKKMLANMLLLGTNKKCHQAKELHYWQDIKKFCKECFTMMCIKEAKWH